jgi:hypothetical protein
MPSKKKPTGKTATARTRIEIYSDSDGQWRGRLKAGNMEIVASSESYTRKEGAIRWARRLVQHAAEAKVVIIPKFTC